MTEIELEWNIFNINSSNNSTGLSMYNTATSAITEFNVSIAIGNYTVKDALDALVVAMGTATGQTFTVVDSIVNTGALTPVFGKKAIVISGVAFRYVFRRVAGSGTPVSGPLQLNLSQRLGFAVFDSSTFPIFTQLYLQSWIAYKPNLLAYNYIDITSSQLASQQKVKDATTSNFDAIDVIYRWVFANDEADPTHIDAYGYPILQGYLPFKSRRYLSFPKQVRWDPLLPIGNLSFQTYTDQQEILEYIGLVEAYEFKMLMLISEV